MATVYSLVCFGGLSGKTVTFTDAGDVVNLTNHGLRQGVTGIVFSTTGTLPTGITAGTTYYPRDGADANKFTIYSTKEDALAGTNQVTFSGTGSGTHTVKSAYMLSLTPEQLARYGSSGSERIFSGVSAWRNSRAGASLGVYDTEVCEIGDAFSDIISTSLTLDLACSATVIHTKVNDVRTEAFHYGNFSNGYELYTGESVVMININSYNCIVDGLRLKTNHGSAQGIQTNKPKAVIRNNLIQALQLYNGNGIWLESVAHEVYNNIIIGFYGGIFPPQYHGTANLVYNNLVAKCDVGMRNGGSSTAGRFYNNISVGNTTNWEAIPGSLEAAAGNAGQSGNTPWNIGAATAITNLVTTDGVDFVAYTNNDFRPASASSKQVGLAVGIWQGWAFDAKDAVRPNYQPAVYPNEVWDIGPFEYDHGNGLAPLQVDLSFSGMAEGSVLAVYKTSDGSAIINPIVIGASGSYSTTYSYTGDVQITVVVRKGSSGTKYLPYSAPGLITSAGFALIVNQVIDGVLNG